MPKFAILAESLHSTANGAITYFKNEHGLKSIDLENPVKDFDKLGLRPSIQGTSAGGSRYCIEVAERLRLPDSVLGFLAECKKKNSPIKFILVIPDGAEDGDPDYAKNLRACKSNGIGVCTVDEDGSGTQHAGALSQLAVGVRHIEFSKYPIAFRSDLQMHMETYLSGNPVKACQGVAEILEDFTRKVVAKAHKEKLYPKVYKHSHSWADICEEMQTKLVREDPVTKKPTKCTPITKRLVSRIHGYTDYRNVVSHKPKNLEELREREIKIRTYFEQFSDLLLELVNASKTLKP